MKPELVTIPARRGKAAHVSAGQRVRVVNTHGTQVVDAWAFNARDVTEWMSMEASRAWFMKLAAAVGDTFVTNRRRPILTLVEDTSGCAHDTLMAPCDPHRYGLLGVEGYHDNCRDNLHAALAALGVTIPAAHIDADRIEFLVQRVRAAADELSRLLDYQPRNGTPAKVLPLLRNR